jgi:radial spoke head protein 4/6
LSLEETPKGAEKRGEGVNYYTYWVANNLIFPEWIELPLITPQHLKTARKIKKHFSGHLDKPIKSDPAFDGLERHYLKAQLVRMTHSLELAPKGLFKPNDENPKLVEYEEEPKVPEFA